MLATDGSITEHGRAWIWERVWPLTRNRALKEHQVVRSRLVLSEDEDLAPRWEAETFESLLRWHKQLTREVRALKAVNRASSLEIACYVGHKPWASWYYERTESTDRLGNVILGRPWASK
jgi:hypothetical protein